LSQIAPECRFYSFCISGIGKEEKKKGKRLSHITGSKDVFFKLTEAPKPPQFINLSGDYEHGGDSMGPGSASSAMKAVSAHGHILTVEKLEKVYAFKTFLENNRHRR